ncbi:MAG TPA: GNAT family protein [Vicinamibacterales bacterium]|jgi:RimJ/RimL family protein N-acetyltransferase|nr:GNAT family protein [Vicinamibacterales bacterium]
MEKMPYQRHLDTVVSTLPLPATTTPTDWRLGLPTLAGSLVVLRDLHVSDAASLLAALSTEEVSRFISPPPASVEAFERFIQWTHCQRAAGQYACFAIVPLGSDVAVGLFQIRALDSGFATAEWGFALASEFWGTGMFVDGAQLTLDFAFDAIGVHRLEARAAVVNGRGTGALRKLGAVHEGLLRRSFLRRGEYLDQVLWTILADEWRESKAVWGPDVIVH